jgi:glycosyltransferase involved in cell wall biosynthesis
MKKLSIVIPAYNEEKRIGKTLEEYSNFFDKLVKSNKIDYQILVVINGTTDNTEQVVKNYKKKYRRIKYSISEFKGKGFAISQGFEESLKEKWDLIGFVDADMATSPEEYWKLIKNIGNFDGAIADRYIKGAEITPKLSFRRIIVSRIFNILVRVVFSLPYKDTQCGAKVFKREVIERVLNKTTITQWAYDIDLLYNCKRSYFKIVSIPANWYEIEGSKLNVKKASIQMFFAVIQLRLLKSPFKHSLKIFSPIIGIIYKLVK